MNNLKRRIAINIGGGFVPGLNAVIAGTVMAAHHLDWDVVGIRDGFDGLLFSERYPDGGTVNLTPRTIGDLYRNPGVLLGTATHTDPFHVRSINAMNGVEEVDRSDELLELLRIQDIDSVISVVGGASDEHTLQTTPQGTEDGLYTEVDRKRYRRDTTFVRFQQRTELRHRDTRPSSPSC